MSKSSLFQVLLIVFMLPLAGCLVVKSDVAKVDEESGALTLEINANSETEGDPVEETAAEPEVDPEELAAQQKKVEEQCRRKQSKKKFYVDFEDHFLQKNDSLPSLKRVQSF